MVVRFNLYLGFPDLAGLGLTVTARPFGPRTMAAQGVVRCFQERETRVICPMCLLTSLLSSRVGIYGNGSVAVVTVALHALCIAVARVPQPCGPVRSVCFLSHLSVRVGALRLSEMAEAAEVAPGDDGAAPLRDEAEPPAEPARATAAVGGDTKEDLHGSGSAADEAGDGKDAAATAEDFDDDWPLILPGACGLILGEEAEDGASDGGITRALAASLYGGGAPGGSGENRAEANADEDRAGSGGDGAGEDGHGAEHGAGADEAVQGEGGGACGDGCGFILTPQAKRQQRKQKGEAKCKCRGCMKGYDLSEFPMSSAFCWECKRALDNIGRQAKAQGKGAQEWFRNTRRDEGKVRKVLQSYFAHCPPRGGTTTKKRGQWSVGSYLETYRASSEVSKKKKGKMMWWGEYLEFATSPAGGKMTDEDAAVQWREMLNDPDAITDEGGPAKAKTRACVEVGVFVNQTDKWSHTKEMALKDKDRKNLSDADVETMKKRLARDHKDGLDEDGQFANMAKGLVQTGASSTAGGMVASGSSSFAGSGVLLGKVEDLLVVDEEAEPPTDGVGGGGDGEGGGGGSSNKGKTQSPNAKAKASAAAAAGGGSPAKAAATGKAKAKAAEAKWFDRVLVGKAARTQREKLESVEIDLLGLQRDMQVKVNELGGRPGEHWYCFEMSNAQERLAAVNAVLGSPEALAKVVGEVMRGELPLPCEDFNPCSTVGQLKKYIEDNITELAIQSEREITAHSKHLEKERKLLSAVAKAGRKALDELASAKQSRDRLESQRQKRLDMVGLPAGETAASKAKAKGAAARASTSRAPRRATRAVFEHGLGAATPLPTFVASLEKEKRVQPAVDGNATAADLVDLDKLFSTPFLVTDPSFANLDKNPAIRPAFLAFTRMLQQQPQLLTATGRASQQVAADAAHAALMEKVVAPLQELWPFATARTLPESSQVPASLRALLDLSIFGISPQSEGVYNEPLHLPTMRLNVQGTRTVLLASALDLNAFFSTTTSSGAAPAAVAVVGELGGGAPASSKGAAAAGVAAATGGGPPGGGAPVGQHGASSSNSEAVHAAALPGQWQSLQHRLWFSFFNMSNETVLQFVQQRFRLMTATVGPGDCLYLPVGWIICERSDGKVMSLGIKFGVLPDCLAKSFAPIAALNLDGKGDQGLMSKASRIFSSFKPGPAESQLQKRSSETTLPEEHRAGKEAWGLGRQHWRSAAQRRNKGCLCDILAKGVCCE